MTFRTAPLTLEPVNKNYNCIDLIKFVMAIFVLTLHELGSNTSIIFNSYLFRLAVPFYFMCTGFLLFRGMDIKNINRSKLWKYTKKIIKVYIIWTAIYIPMMISDMLHTGHTLSEELLLRIKNFFFFGSYGQLWYLLATIVSVWLIYICVRLTKSLKVTLLISAILYLIGLIPQVYWGIFKDIHFIKTFFKVIGTTRNGIFFGFFFMVLGMIFAIKPIKFSFKTANTLFILSMLLFLAEVLILNHFSIVSQADMWLMLAPASFLLFYLVAHIDLKDSRIWKLLREVGILIFYSHVFIGLSYGFLFNKLSHYMDTTILSTPYIKYILVVITTMLLSYFIVKLSKVKHFKWLKNLYA